ncbi:SGNH/GDSL hydrolase family protein [Edaphobacter sp. 12200R-103]|uniref:SGNH/GDSL hydrolase family protein n=1 Tax=Edaphobacter sp. 12200R-103 TaxID=2703788 RepID=UPI00138B32B4|nr:SGNH/GDSL hydrolase family protein [Edaphobacter sp. 12200R-103]QHS51097.1 hypothetical protein GWR55_04615 [Edaphobacter sp. 12200R-103]
MNFLRRRLNSADTTSQLDFINSRPFPPDAFKVLFIGDSLMIHGQLKGVWDVSSGMAASRPENDYVHLVSKGLQEEITRPAEALYNNGGNGRLREILEYIQVRNLAPDMVIIQGGENDTFDRQFREYYPQLLDFYACPRIVLGDWFSKDKSDYSGSLCRERGLPFVNLCDISADKQNSGWGGPYDRKDVASHPNDSGHAAIAKGVLAKVKAMVLQNI